MSLRLSVIALAVLALLGWIVSQGMFFVQQGEQAILIRLGNPVATISEPGLQFKLPVIDTLIVFNRRLLTLEPLGEQIILGDQKRIEVQTYAKFRIADALKFYQSFGTEDQARASIAQVVSTALRKQLGKVPLPSLLTSERDQIMGRVESEVAQEEKNYGVEIVNVRLRRADLPVETSKAIYDRMTSERVRQATELRAQGFERAQQIRSKADRERAVLLSVAQRDSQTNRGIADAEANRIATTAYDTDPEFFELYRTLQLYKSALTQGGPTFVLSPDSELMRFFGSGPLASKINSGSLQSDAAKQKKGTDQ